MEYEYAGNKYDTKDELYRPDLSDIDELETALKVGVIPEGWGHILYRVKVDLLTPYWRHNSARQSAIDRTNARTEKAKATRAVNKKRKSTKQEAAETNGLIALFDTEE
jgi:hypothetical protein